MSVSPARRAVWDQERRMITDNIRRYGVHLTYVGGEGAAGCACCWDGGEADEGDPLADVVGALDPCLQPRPGHYRA